ncbi:MAG: hypothetical protein AAGA68_12665 [Pseudomonadota bacterium]
MIEKYLNRLPKIGGQGDRRLLVLEYDGFRLRASITARNAGAIRLLTHATVAGTVAEEALNTVLTQLRGAGEAIPRDVILLHVSVVTSVIAPPIADGTDLTTAQTTEMVRWEMEGLYSDVAPTWDIGWLLMGMLYLDADQREEVLTEMDAQRGATAGFQPGGRPSSRFGEIAIDRGYITEAQLDECLQLQERLQLGDAGIRVGWTPLDTTPRRWLTTAVDVSTHSQWVELLSRVGKQQKTSLTLHGLYAIPGTSCALLNLKQDENACVLEVHDAYVSVSLLTSEGLTRIATLKASSRRVDAVDIHPALRDMPVTGCTFVIFVGVAEDSDAIRLDLEGAFPDTPFVPLAGLLADGHSIAGERVEVVGGAPLEADALPALGAARAWFNELPTMTTAVAGMPPPPAFYRRREGQIAIAVAVALAVPLLTEAYHAFSQSRLRTQLIRLEDQRADVRRLEKASSDARSLDAERQRLQEERRQLDALKTLVQSALIERQDFVPSLLPLIANTANSGIVVNMIDEESWNEFRITGYARDQRAADAYYTDLSRQLERFELRVLDSPTTLTVDKAGVPRYEFSYLIGRPRTTQQAGSAQAGAARRRSR